MKEFKIIKIKCGKGICFILQRYYEPEHDAESWLNEQEWYDLMILIRRWKVGMYP